MMVLNRREREPAVAIGDNCGGDVWLPGEAYYRYIIDINIQTQAGHPGSMAHREEYRLHTETKVTGQLFLRNITRLVETIAVLAIRLYRVNGDAT